ARQPTRGLSRQGDDKGRGRGCRRRSGLPAGPRCPGRAAQQDAARRTARCRLPDLPANDSRAPRGASGHVRGGSMKCTQPGCTGTIVDGYCDVCGSPGPAEGSAVPSAVASGNAAAATAGVEGPPCTQPGCTGTIVDGYCDVCGTPAAAGAQAGGEDRAPIS